MIVFLRSSLLTAFILSAGYTLAANNVLDLEDCRTNTFQTTAPDLFGGLKKQCRPDTLYSWGDENKLNGFRRVLGNSAWPDKMRTLFLARSPISTFGYGPIPLRIKLMPGVKFKRDNEKSTCEGLPEEATTVFYRRDGVWSDWVICSPAVIHSWSVWTQSHYEEIQIGFDAHKNGDDVDYYSKFQFDKKNIFSPNYFPPSLDGKAHDILNHDGKDFREITFNEYIENILKNVIENKGEIFFNPTLRPHDKTPECHFRTMHPIYFNPN
jgi:hypothetical protein